MSIFKSFASNALGRAGKGAALGGAVGYANSGDLSGTLSGAGFGAAAGVGYGGAISHFGGAARIGRRGLGAMGRGAKAVQNRAIDGGIASVVAGRGASAVRHGRVADAARGARGLFASGADLIGQNRAMVNKWGGRALAGLGVGSASLMGSSMINSNQGY